MSVKETYAATSIAEQAIGVEHPSREVIWKRALEVFDGEELARQWMNTPLPLLHNYTPQQWVDSGDAERKREVLTILAGIDYGMYS
jgi:uncharacterized protein (DUF2384 family)